MPKFKIELPGTVRIKKNSRRPVMIGGKYKPRRLVILPSAGYTKWEKAARVEARLQWKGSHPLSVPVSVEVLAFIEAKKGQIPDLSGVLESVGDCLEGIAWENDNQIYSWDGSRVLKVGEGESPKTIVYVKW